MRFENSKYLFITFLKMQYIIVAYKKRPMGHVAHLKNSSRIITFEMFKYKTFKKGC